MSEKLETIETLKETESHGFIAKMKLAMKVLPLVEQTSHKEVILDCFEKPQHGPPVEVKGIGEGKSFREWPTNSDELIKELNGRQILLKQRMENLERQKGKFERRQGKLKPDEQAVMDLVMSESKFAETRAKSRKLRKLRDYLDPVHLPEVREKLSQTEAVLDFVKDLAAKGRL